MNKLGIYIHWPYCISKCPYCDFNSHKIKNYNPNDWLVAYKNQIKYFKDYLLTQNFRNKKISSIFFWWRNTLFDATKANRTDFIFYK